MLRRRLTRLVEAVTSISHKATAPVTGLRDSLRAVPDSLANGVRGARTSNNGTWARLRGNSDPLTLPVVRQYSGWFGRQSDYVQAALIILSLVMAFLLAVAGGWIGLKPPRVQAAQAKSQPVDLAGILYALNKEQPAPPEIKCEPFETDAACQRRLAAAAELHEDRFSDYVRQAKAEQQQTVWERKGDAFPKYDANTGGLAFTFALEGKAQGKPKPAPKPTPIATPNAIQKRLGQLLAKTPFGQGDAKTCTPLRIIARTPAGVAAGTWPDQGDAETKAKPFVHPCLRAPEWKAVVRVDPETAAEWEKRAKADGWRLVMFFRVEDWESALHPNWAEDVRLRDDDLLPEQRVWLWVDEVQLVIGDLVVQRWR